MLDKEIISKTEKDLNELIHKNTLNIFLPKEQKDIFKIFKICTPNDIKVVVLGQDPYYADINQANGIAFAVHEHLKIPPSLKNIFKELKNNYPDATIDKTLESWVKSGVFLLNTSLTVTKGKPGSHMNIWKSFTDHVIQKLSKDYDSIIFVLLGNFAEKKRDLICTNNNKNRILSYSHPSPLSCYKTDKPFIGSNLFKNINGLLNNKIKF